MADYRSFDVLGNVVLVKFPRGTTKTEKKKFASKIMANNKSVKTVLEKIGKFSGRLRKQKTSWVLGLKTKEAIYKENGCIFRFNVDKTYFSSRLSNERKDIAEKIKKDDHVLVMFAGVAPYSIVIAKKSKAKMVYSNEINREANKYGRLNAELNKVKDKVVFLDGDIKKVAKRLKEKFDVIVMPRPQLKDSFLAEAFKLSKKGTRIFYYDFCDVNSIGKIKDKIKEEARRAGKKIKILNVKKAGEVGVRRYRIRVDFKVL